MSDSRSDRRIRLALVGAGAVGEARYIPGAARIPDLELTHLVDLDLERTRRLAEKHGIAGVSDDYRDILDDVDAVIVATPPAAHRAIAVDCLASGVHVLCEKPLAASPEEGEAMVAAANASEALLTVGMVRRYGRSARLLRRCAELGMVGDVLRVDAEEGGEFTWPLRTSHIFDAAQGGVLRDTGSHLLDLVFWMADATGAHVTGYQDDSWGGPEANARADLEMETPSGSARGRVQVSFTRTLRNRIRIEGREGVLEAPTLGGAEIVFMSVGSTEPVRLTPGDGQQRSRTEDFVLQLEDFATAIRSSGPPPVPAESALLPLRVIESCFGSRKPMLREWEFAPDQGASNRASNRNQDPQAVGPGASHV